MILYNGCLYIHIPKTGGTSIRTTMTRTRRALLLTRVRPTDVEDDGVIHAKFNPHAFIQEAMYGMSPHLYQALWKFTCVRNPWDRYVSLYYFRCADKPQPPFPRFLKHLLKKKYTQSKYLSKYPFNFVAKLETIEEDWEVIARQMRLKVEPLMRLNTSKREDRHYTEMYTDEMRDGVEKAERYLIHHHGYRFES